MSDFLRLFGAPSLQPDGSADARLLDWQVPVALVAYLACKPGWHSRESLATMLRPDAAAGAARAYLRRLLHRTREVMPGLVALEVQEARLRWNGDCDVREFENAIATARWQHCVDLQRQPLLDDAGSTGSRPLDDWFDEERRRLRQKLGAALRALIGEARQGGVDAAAWITRLADHDPLDEDGVLFVLQHARTAMERQAASAAFETLERRMPQELGRGPAPRTTELYRAVRSVTPVAAGAAVRPAGGAHDLAGGSSAPLGRDAEVAALDLLLRDDNARLVTIHGFGGVGKTLLARCLHARAAQRATPAVWVDLLAVDTAHGLLDALASRLGAPAREGSMEDQLAHWLGTRRALIFLDNFEQLRAHAPTLSRLLSAAKGIRFVVTSRETLRLPEEYSFALGGLAWRGSDCAAARLFAVHAQRLGAGLGPGDEEAVEELVGFLEGLPLAIELAAHWVTLLSPRALLTELRNNPGFLDASPAPGSESRSMRSVFTAAWKRMDAAERTALASLSVVRTAMSLEAARAVSGSDAAVLLRLVEKSLLQRSPAGVFRLHPLVKEFAGSHADPAQLAQARVRHAQHFLQYLAHPPALRIGQHLPERVAQLLPQAEDIAEAWRAAVDNARWDLIAAAAPNCLGFLFMASRYEDAQALATHTLERLDADHPFAATFASFRALAAFRLGHVDEAESVTQAALARQPQGGGLVLLLLAMSRIHRFRGRTQQALAAAQQALELVADSDVFVRMRVTEDLALCHWTRGDMKAAEWHMLANLTLAKQNDAPFVEARALCLLGFVKEASGNAADALKLLESSVEIFGAMGDVYQIAFCRRGMSYAFLRLGDHRRQQEAAEAALAVFTEAGYRHEIGESLLAVALAQDARGGTREALATLQKALKLCLQEAQVPIALYCIAAMGSLLAGSDRGLGIALIRFAMAHPAWRKPQHPVIEERHRSLGMAADEGLDADRQAAHWTLDEVVGMLSGALASLGH